MRLIGVALFVYASVLFLLFVAFNGGAEGQEGMLQNCPQPTKWAISVWSGDDGTDVDQAMDTCGEGAVLAAYGFDPDTQAWKRWLVERPDISNLESLGDMEGIIALGGKDTVAEVTLTPKPSLTPTPTTGPGDTPTATPPAQHTPTPVPTPIPSSTPISTPTPIPTPIPTPTPTPTPAPTILFFSGEGCDWGEPSCEVGPFSLTQGWSRFSFTYEGMFYTCLYNMAGEWIGFSYGGTIFITIPATANYIMRLRSQSPWTITIEQ